MNATERTTAVGVFPNRTQANRAVEELRRNGFRTEEIGMVVSEGAEEIQPPPLEPGTRVPEGAVAGAAAGSALGGLLGVALSTVVIPGLGPVIAGGMLVGALAGVATGLASGGIVGALVGLNVPEDEAQGYEREFRSGRTLVTVRAVGRYDEARQILQQVAEDDTAEGGSRPRPRRISDGGQVPGTGSITVGQP